MDVVFFKDFGVGNQLCFVCFLCEGFLRNPPFYFFLSVSFLYFISFLFYVVFLFSFYFFSLSFCFSFSSLLMRLGMAEFFVVLDEKWFVFHFFDFRFVLLDIFLEVVGNVGYFVDGLG